MKDYLLKVENLLEDFVLETKISSQGGEIKVYSK